MSGQGVAPRRRPSPTSWALAGLALAACDPAQLRLFERVAVAPAPDAAPSRDAGAGVTIETRDAAPMPGNPPEVPDAAVDSCPRGPSGQCVECREDSDCSPELPACDVARNVCVGCVDDSYCGGARPYCDVGLEATFACQECVEDNQCSGDELCQFEANEPEEGLHCED